MSGLLIQQRSRLKWMPRIEAGCGVFAVKVVRIEMGIEIEMEIESWCCCVHLYVGVRAPLMTRHFCGIDIFVKMC